MKNAFQGKASMIGRSLLAAAVLFGAGLVGAQTTQAIPLIQTTFYVSPSGDNTTGDSWQHAYSDMDKIPWARMTNGANIVIDGGQGNWNSPLNYYHGIVVPSTAPAVTISLSTEPFHNGAARIYAPSGNTTAAGITILTAAQVVVNGRTPYGLQLANFPVGVSVQNHGNAWMSFLQIMGQGTGVPAGTHGAVNTCTAILVGGGSTLTINRTAALDYRYIAVSYGHSTLSMSNDWLLNYNWAPGPSGMSAGVVNQGGASNVNVTNCVLGPGLNYGVANMYAAGLPAELPTATSITTVNNCLLIQPAVQGLTTLAQGTMSCDHITEFSTVSGVYGRNPDSIASSSPLVTAMQVKDSIVVGGTVSVPAFAHPLTANNSQFRTAGNTRFLSDRQANPFFQTLNPYMTNPANITDWINLNFNSNTHQGTGQGSSINSVNDLLNSWYYSAVATL